VYTLLLSLTRHQCDDDDGRDDKGNFTSWTFLWMGCHYSYWTFWTQDT